MSQVLGFGVVFVGISFPISNQYFQQVDPTHWVIDACQTVTPDFQKLKDVALFLGAPNVLPSDMALALYVKAGQSAWQFRGYVANIKPSDVMPLEWPGMEGDQAGLMHQQGGVQVGVALENLQEVSEKVGAQIGTQMEFARRVALDLYRFMESFSSVSGDLLQVPTNIIERWYAKFQDKFKRDPEFLTRQKDKF